MDAKERNLRIADELDALKVGHTVWINDSDITRQSEVIYCVDDECLTFYEAYLKVTGAA